MACSSHPPHSTLNRDAYLQQFIGQSSTIYPDPFAVKPNWLSTSLVQLELPQQCLTLPVSFVLYVIPIPMAQHPTTGIGAVPLNMGIPSHESYDVALTCYIVFSPTAGYCYRSVRYRGQRC